MLKEKYRKHIREDYRNLPSGWVYIPQSIRLWWLNQSGFVIILISSIGGMIAAGHLFWGILLEAPLVYFVVQTWPKRWLLSLFIGWWWIGILFAWFVEGVAYQWL